jgi:pseudouridine-5'-phosphate glycosidase/sugar/nucleoside kinase (ribokinase family)
MDIGKAGSRAQKCSTREISMIISKHNNSILKQTNLSSNIIGSQWGATTVASTMFLAHAAGINTFVTGGIGGVHRHGENSMDISADLIELSRTPVVVVSAGIKSILDIRRTLEMLETYGVPTIGYQTDEFPAFFSSTSGFPTPMRMDHPSEIATSYHVARQLGAKHGFLVAVPNKHPAGNVVEEAIQQALREADEAGIAGQAVTPYILRCVAEKTSGESLKSNIELVKQNTVVGAEIAIAISKRSNWNVSTNKLSYKNMMTQPPRVVVVGGVVFDIISKPSKNEKLVLGTSNPSVCYESDGGVGRNIAEVLARLGSNTAMYSTIGNDSRGKGLRQRLGDCGIISLDATIATIENQRSATYVAILNENGDLHTACADMDVFNFIASPPSDVIANADVLVMDANPALKTLQQAARIAKSKGTKVFFEPTSMAKARRIAADDAIMSCITYASPNLDELLAMDGSLDEKNKAYGDPSYIHDWSQTEEAAQRVLARMCPNEAHLIITCGEAGVLLASRSCINKKITFQMFPPDEGVNIQNATGAGDTLAGAFVHAILNGCSIVDAVKIGIEAASISLQYSEGAISPHLSSFIVRKCS